MNKFSFPVYTTRPLLPDLNSLKDKLNKVWESQTLTNNGFQHQLLEKKLAATLKVPYLSLFNNGTIALIIACQSLRLSGEVLTTPFTFAATPHVLNWNNIKPIFCDINPHTLTIDPNKIESMITPLTTAILAVHVFGIPCDVVKIQEIADRYGLKVIYDAAHAFQTEIDGVGIGNFGDISMFSFHATKLFHTAEGGALTFKDQLLKPRIDLLKNFGIKNEEEVIMPGINGKMNELQATMGLLVLEMLKEERRKRKILADTYRECLQNVEGITIIGNDKFKDNNSLQYLVLRINERVFGRSRDYIYDEFKKFNVFTRKYFYPLCSNYYCYKQLPSANPHNLPVANQIVNEVLAMPFYGGLASEDIEKICLILKSFQKSRRGINYAVN